MCLIGTNIRFPVGRCLIFSKKKLRSGVFLTELKVECGNQDPACFTASTQRSQSVGCSLCEPTSVSQCQQRSHFWPFAVWTAVTISAGPSKTMFNRETFNNS